MTLRDASMDYQLHSDLLLRALGRGGAPVDLAKAQQHYDSAIIALRTLGTALREARQEKAR
jgi:hypothetical protein